MGGTRYCLWGTSLGKPGDEAQITACIQLLNRFDPDCEITVFTKEKDRLKQVMQGTGYRVKAVRTAKVHRVFAEISRSDMLLFIGGPFYSEKRQAWVASLLMNMCRAGGTKPVTFAATVFPYSRDWAKRKYRKLFQNMHSIFLRDVSARDVLETIDISEGVEVMPDLRYSLTPAPEDEIDGLLREENLDPDRPIALFSLRYMSEDAPDWVKESHGFTVDHVKHANGLLSAIASRLSKDHQLLLLPMHPSIEDDRQMKKILDSRPDGDESALIRPGLTSRQLLGIFQKSHLAVISRMGSSIFATTTRTPMLTIAYDSRLSDYMESIGLDSYSFDWKTAGEEEVIKALESIGDHRQSIRDLLGQVKDRKMESIDHYTGRIVKLV